MSIHKSLALHGKLKRHRNVLSRTERLLILSKEEKRKETDSVFGLLKVKNLRQKTKAKGKKEKEAETTVAGTVAPETTTDQTQAKSTEKQKSTPSK